MFASVQKCSWIRVWPSYDLDSADQNHVETIVGPYNFIYYIREREREREKRFLVFLQSARTSNCRQERIDTLKLVLIYSCTYHLPFHLPTIYLRTHSALIYLRIPNWNIICIGYIYYPGIYLCSATPCQLNTPKCRSQKYTLLLGQCVGDKPLLHRSRALKLELDFEFWSLAGL